MTLTSNPSLAEEVRAWITAVGGLAGFIALAIALWQNRAKRSLPREELRGLLESLIEDFNDITASGGRPQNWFLEKERVRRELRLASLNGAIVDDGLNRLVGDCRADYLDCWSLATTTADPRRVQRQVDSANKGVATAGKALDRMNELIRKYAHL